MRPSGEQSGTEKVIAGRKGCHGGLVANKGDTFGFNIAAADCWTNGVFMNSGAISNFTDWHYVVGVYDNRSMKIYVDGTLKNEAAFASGMYGYSDEFYIGGIGTYVFDGLIDEVAVYRTAFTATEVWKHYTMGAGRYSFAQTQEK